MLSMIFIQSGLSYPSLARASITFMFSFRVASIHFLDLSKGMATEYSWGCIAGVGMSSWRHPLYLINYHDYENCVNSMLRCVKVHVHVPLVTITVDIHVLVHVLMFDT
ncbi:hypothetical protein DFP73DRAFT_232662 [Morchella snyderi]|nr:hypothetical protein DFP73DRAFT_232662 [Morchella snyderi]